MEKTKNTELILLGRKVVPRCPYIPKSLDGCYCTNMKSTRVEEAIYYCGANYTACQVYMDLKKKSRSLFTPSITDNPKAIGL